LLRRRRARRSLIEFTTFTLPKYQPAAHHVLIAEKLEAAARGEIDRLMVNMPPRHGKSELASRRFPAFLLGTNPQIEIVVASYNADKAREFGYEVRDIVRSDEYRALFPGVQLKEDSRAADRWNTDAGGSFRAVGIGTALTGRGADVLLIDDPIKDDEEADSELRRERIWAWYSSVAYTRLSPGGRIVVIQCLTGDAMIAMADGSEKRLDRITVGDRVLSWDGNDFVGSPVDGIIDNGFDQTFLIKTRGSSVRANARHPFLVLSDKGLRWVRTKDLRSGMRILRYRTEPTRANCARSRDAASRQNAGGCATAIMRKRCGRQGIGRLQRAVLGVWRTAASGVMESIKRRLIACLPSKAAFAPFAGQMAAPGVRNIGSPTSFPIITTRQGQFEGCCATTATGLRDELEIPPSWNAPSHTCEPDTDDVVSITPCGSERVYDLSVAGTHNFVANGLWTHNTRWHEDDLTGRLLAEQAKGGDQWDILELPAITSDGRALWPERYPLEYLERIKRVTLPRHWSALYQQRPAPEEGAYFKREWFRWYDAKPQHLRIYGASDYAVTDGDGDYTVHVVVGIDPDDNLYVLDVWRGQTDSDVWVSAWLDLVRRWKPLLWAEEQGQIVKSIGPFLEKRMREERTYCRREQFASAADKPTRSRSIQARAAMGKVYLPSKAPWLADFTAELLMFPAGKHDDQVDSFGLIGRMLDEMARARAPKPETRPLRDGYARAVPAQESWRA
jgi:predicted phage terminase large subunit-like protein